MPSARDKEIDDTIEQALMEYRKAMKLERLWLTCTCWSASAFITVMMLKFVFGVI